MTWHASRRRLAALHGRIFARRKVFSWIMAGLILVALVQDLWQHWGDLKRIDWMILTGLPVGLAFVVATNDVRRRFDALVDSLSNQDILRFMRHGPGAGLEGLVEDPGRRDRLRRRAKRRIEEEAALWGFAVCLLFVPLCLVVLELLITAKDIEFTARAALLHAVVVPMSLVCGLRLGRMACYGWQGLSYRTFTVGHSSVLIEPMAGHADGSAGLSPIGAFYSYQVGRMTWLVGYLVIWLLLLTYVEDGTFVQGELQTAVSLGLLALFGLIFLMQWLGFFLPMVSIHRELAAWRAEAAERHYTQLSAFRHALAGGAARADPERALQAIVLRHEREDLASLNLWPVSSETLRNFWIGKALTLLAASVPSYTQISSLLNGG